MLLFGRGNVDSADNHGPVVSVLTWFLTVTAVLWVFARAATKWAVSHKIAFDDYLIFLALAFSIGQCVAVSLQVQNGLGSHITTLSSARTASFQKADYASNMLFIVTVGLAKLSVLVLLYNLSPIRLHHQLAIALSILISTWILTSELVAAFQCGTPQTWRILNNTCINHNAFWTYFGTLNLFTDAALIVIPLVMTWKLQVEAKRKLSVAVSFASRILAMAATITSLVLINRTPNPSTDDMTYNLWPVALCNQFVQNLGIVVSCIPYIKPLLESLESGMIRTDDLRRLGMTGVYGYGGGSNQSRRTKTYKLSDLATRSRRSGSKDQATFRTAFGAEEQDYIVPPAGSNFATATAVSRSSESRPEWDAESQKSFSRMIKQTTSWAVER